MGACCGTDTAQGSVEATSVAEKPRIRSPPTPEELASARRALEGVFPPTVTDAQIEELVSTGSLNAPAYIKKVKFSQGGVHPGFSSGLLLREAAVDFRETGWRSDLPCIRCVLFLGSEKATLISWDNRRLTMLRYLESLGKCDTVPFDLVMGEELVPESMREMDVTLSFPVFKAAVPATLVTEFLNKLGIQDGGMKDLSKDGVPAGFKPKSWGQMIFHRTYQQTLLGSVDFPIDGSITPPISALDREEVYMEYCLELSAHIESVKNQAKIDGKRPTWVAKGFDFKGNQSIFDRRSLKSLNELLRELPREEFLKRVPYLAEWCSQVFDGNGFTIPPSHDQCMTSEEVAERLFPDQKFLEARVDKEGMVLEFEAVQDGQHHESTVLSVTSIAPRSPTGRIMPRQVSDGTSSLNPISSWPMMRKISTNRDTVVELD